jgi:hypothetical protein
MRKSGRSHMKRTIDQLFNKQTMIRRFGVRLVEAVREQGFLPLEFSFFKEILRIKKKYKL